jgi:iron(III) transport system ATP-binding protein
MRVRLSGITKTFGSLKALDRVDLLIEEGRFFTLLGPSGCGKTTLLRVLAGFTRPDSGDIFFGDQRINHLPPYKRETGMVFQNYALFPHLDVFGNVAYGLMARKIPKDEIRSRVHQVLEKVQLENLAHRSPGQLSGGQQQRVALARALVIHPKVLLMDEPLSNLDAKLRVAMRQEIRSIQRGLGITTVYVTHDQEEAMAVSDSIAIFNHGEIEQFGTPSEIYFRPRNRFVAEFTGTSNLMEVEVIAYDPETSLLSGDLKGNQIVLRYPRQPVEKRVTILLRPEWIKIAREEEEPSPNLFSGQVISSTFVGFMVKYQVKAFGDQVIAIEVQDPQEHEIKNEGDALFFRFQVHRPVVIASRSGT